MRTTVALALAMLFMALPGVPQAAADSSAGAGRQQARDAAAALGGLERVTSIRNITLIGYGIYAYQFGGGNVTAGRYAGQRFMAANDLRRVYDLEHTRFQQQERRNMLFTFARASPTQWEPYNLVLDGDVAYDIFADGAAERAQRWSASAWHVDGVHMRRMWMLNNPVALVRAALDPATRVGNPHVEDGAPVLDLTLKEGDRLSFATDPRTHLPLWVRWSNPHNTFGQHVFTTHFEGYAPFKGLLLPMSYNTKIGWRDVSELTVYVDGYDIDGRIPDLAAPAAVRNAPEPQVVLSDITVTKVAKGIWHLVGGPKSRTGYNLQGTTVFEFDDHLTLFELNSKVTAQKIIDTAKTLVPGKVPTQLITSHAHPDHIDGIRVAVANGIAIISRRENELIMRDMVGNPTPDYPDVLSLNPKPLDFIPVDEHLRLQDKSMTVDVYWARTNSHMADGLFAYAPSAKVMAEADIATAAFDYQPWADNYMDVIEHYKLDVEQLLPVHFRPMPQAEVIEFIKGGVKRYRERCAFEAARGIPYQGCPVLTERY
jgi:glyoxylase-like metal-dependent hydrolase (beta-lactamase superfamily II)